MGAEDEQHQIFSGGNRTDGTDIQLNNKETKPDSEELSSFSLSEPEDSYGQLSLFPSLEEEVGNIAAAEVSIKYTMPAAFSLPQEKALILEIILFPCGLMKTVCRLDVAHRQKKHLLQ